MALLLYTGITPNTSNGKHYLYDSLTTYKNFLSTNLLKSITLDNYRINANIIKVKLDHDITASNYTRVTYALNEFGNTFYIVNDAIIKSGYVIYTCTVDNWGTYISDASLSNICVQRCNRNIGIGVYQDINATKTNVQVPFAIPQEYQVEGHADAWKFNEMYVVFSLTFNVEQTTFGGISACNMFALNLKELYDKYVDSVKDEEERLVRSLENPLDIALNIVGGIYGVKANSNYGISTTNDAKVTKCYFIPSNLIYMTGVRNVISVKSKSMYGNYDELGVYEISNIQVYRTFTITANPNYNYYVGSYNKGIKLIRTTENAINVTFKCINKNTDLQVIVMQGDNQEDITTEFETTVTLNDGDITNLSAIFHVLSTGLKAGGAIVGGMTAQTPKGQWGAVGSALGAAAYALEPLQNHFYGKQEGSGDGLSTFWRAGFASAGIGIRTPFVYTECESINDEQEIARKYGAMFNTYVPSLTSIYSYDLLGTGTFSDTYVQANVNVDGVPTVARNEIKQKLQQGIYLIQL